MQNCKNCNLSLSEENKFCSNCGAEIITERITIQKIIKDFFNQIFGWDNKYFVTIKSLLLQPQVILSEYLSGTRKKYINPIPFLAIGLTITILIFNIFTDSYVEVNSAINEGEMDMIAAIFDQLENDHNIANPYKDPEFRTEQLENSKKYQKFALKYFNLFILIALPFYALFSKIVYGKPLNYGEHLITNLYIQGVTFLGTSFFFLLSVLISPSLYFFTLLFTIIFYTYVYGKLYKLRLLESIGKLLLFFVVLGSFIFLIGILLFILGVVIGILSKM